jgi:hypothetical protein
MESMNVILILERILDRVSDDPLVKKEREPNYPVQAFAGPTTSVGGPTTSVGRNQTRPPPARRLPSIIWNRTTGLEKS